VVGEDAAGGRWRQCNMRRSNYLHACLHDHASMGCATHAMRPLLRNVLHPLRLLLLGKPVPEAQDGADAAVLWAEGELVQAADVAHQPRGGGARAPGQQVRGGRVPLDEGGAARVVDGDVVLLVWVGGGGLARAQQQR